MPGAIAGAPGVFVICLGLTDARDCFHCHIAPRWMQDFSRLDAVPAWGLNAPGNSWDGEVALEATSMVHAAWVLLPVGWPKRTRNGRGETQDCAPCQLHVG